MEVPSSWMERVGFRQYGVDSIVASEVVFPPKLLLVMQEWRDSYRSVFETLMLITNCGQYGILITGPELHKVAKVSVPAVFIATKFLEEQQWVIKEKNNAPGNPNIYFVNTDKIKEYAGDAKV
jgi:predicted transcriptional regulator